MKKILFLFYLILLASCQKSKDPITSNLDYDKYLVATNVSTTSKYFELWNSKIKPDSLQLLSLGNVSSEYERFFKETGDIVYLKKAEEALSKAVDIAAIGKAGYFRALSRNYIAQHRFPEALKAAEFAEMMGSGKKETQGLLFDIYMELGNYQSAEEYLKEISQDDSFASLIRVAKWNDYIGDLDTTINLMEKALAKAQIRKDRSLLVWSFSNLADYYGHAGRIEDSYRNYLNTLALDPQNAYAKKGIAWIVYSHEKNPKEALRILESVADYNKSPDYYALMAEISEYAGDLTKTKEYERRYVQLYLNPMYGKMYNTHIAELWLNKPDKKLEGLKLAALELENRNTPEVCSLLAFAYLKNNDLEKAKEIADSKVWEKTFEPASLLRIAEIYNKTKDFEKLDWIRSELESAKYELGPLTANGIDFM